MFIYVSAVVNLVPSKNICMHLIRYIFLECPNSSMSVLTYWNARTRYSWLVRKFLTLRCQNTGNLCVFMLNMNHWCRIYVPYLRYVTSHLYVISHGVLTRVSPKYVIVHHTLTWNAHLYLYHLPYRFYLMSFWLV